MLDERLFRKAASNWASGVAVVTATDCDEGPSGLTMTSVTTLSLNPPQYLVCLDQKSATLKRILKSRMFCINYLNAAQQEVSRIFATKNADKLDILDRFTSNGVPYVSDAISIIECRMAQSYPGGDHTIIIGDVLNAEYFGGDPLVYFRGGYREISAPE
ncbi:flavin reductase family protein [Bradyrhizobium sp. Ce-3]|uniref:flavin reductase family protein n=1 Tax=Bradyrhizobium sp. Ce-3 TaxID=2913970 RepID=UPI001FC8016A|nr:flavin reductase family protein [Bradyrhizobium sp. Ce-3]GKQ55118.1 flavin reductase [Bradyrhizobium sp. Ce-3]